jgi:carbon monoxide dehydrogenase subunit G
MNHSGTFLTPRSAEEVFDLIAEPQRFGSLLPDYESMSVQDATHFTMSIKIEVGKIIGHANLAMELRDAIRPDRVAYYGHGIVAGSQFNFAMQFQFASAEVETRVSWQGEVSIDGMLAMMAGGLLEPIARKNFELMTERLQDELRRGDATNQAPANGTAGRP